MFSRQFSIHKRKKISKSVNKHYILAKILNFNSGKKKSPSDMCQGTFNTEPPYRPRCHARS